MKKVLVNKFAYLMLLVSVCLPAHADYSGKNSLQRKENSTIVRKKQSKKTTKNTKDSTNAALASNQEATESNLEQTMDGKVAKKVTAWHSLNVKESEYVNRNIAQWVTIVTPQHPQEATSNNNEIKGTVVLSNSYELRGMKPFEKMNNDLCSKLEQEISAINQKANASLIQIAITGYSAPSGNPQKSEKLSMERMLAIKECLRTSSLTNLIETKMNWVAEDWNSLTQMVNQSDMMFREAVLGIVNNTRTTQNREKVLQQLADGIPYRYLKERFFPLLEKIEYTISYTSKEHSNGVKGTSTTQGAISYENLYTTAQQYAKDSQEFNDLMDIGARLFTENPQANINAAAVALMRKDTIKARHYLERFSTLPAAFNNMGLLCLLEGNKEKAELYLEMAKAQGVNQTQELLTQLRKK